jgi:hypothetical protein
LTKKTTFVRVYIEKEEGLSDLPSSSVLSRQQGPNLLPKFMPLFVKRKEVKGSEETGKHGVGFGGFGGVFLWLRVVCGEGYQGEMPEVRCGIHD